MSNRIVLSEERLAGAVGDRWSKEQLGEVVDLLARTGGRFPPGVRKLPAELIRDVQRERLLEGMLRTVAEVGYRSLTVQDVLARAGVSRPTFYEQFGDKEACFLAAFDGAAARLRDRLRTATAGEGGWRERLRAGLTELARFAVEEPEAARTLIVEARASSAAGLRRRDELLDSFATWIDGVAREDLEQPPSALAAVGVVGGIESVLYAHLRQDESSDLESLVPSLMYFAVLAYAGREAAGDELEAVAAG